MELWSLLVQLSFQDSKLPALYNMCLLTGHSSILQRDFKSLWENGIKVGVYCNAKILKSMHSFLIIHTFLELFENPLDKKVLKIIYPSFYVYEVKFLGFRVLPV